MENKTKRPRITGTINELTKGEQLLIWRRRCGWNQSQAAKHYGISIFSYKLAEYSRLENFKYPQYKTELQPWEKCLIYRKRAGFKQSEIAKKLGICRGWLRLQEVGEIDCSRLLSWWES